MTRRKKRKSAPRKRKSKSKPAAVAQKEVVKEEAAPSDVEWTGDRVIELRKRLGLTQEQFSHRLGVAYVTVNRWENGKFQPKGLSLEALRRMEAGVTGAATAAE